MDRGVRKSGTQAWLRLVASWKAATSHLAGGWMNFWAIVDKKIRCSQVAFKFNVLFPNDTKLKQLASGFIACGELNTQLKLEFEELW